MDPLFVRLAVRVRGCLFTARAIRRGVVWVATFSLALPALAQQGAIPSANVNMVRGTDPVTGDPFLQRQNEPSIAVSTRNPCHLLAGANDYRTVDLPDPTPIPNEMVTTASAGAPAAKDAWLGAYQSNDCGATWRSSLIPGFPQDVSPQGLASPNHGFPAGADPTVRAGTNGLFLYSGIVFERVDNGKSQIFVARYIDNNNKERGDTIQYVDTTVIALGTKGQFVDKPWLAVDRPRAAFGPQAETWTTSDDGLHTNANTSFADTKAYCDINGQRFPSGNAYMAWTRFDGDGLPDPSKLMFARSTDCGKTWQVRPISNNQKVSHAASIAIAPNDGTVFVAWREIARNSRPPSIHLIVSRDGGKTFGKPAVVANGINPFDQEKSTTKFRTKSFPTIAADNFGRVYIAWAERGFAAGAPDPLTGDARIVIAVSKDYGKTFVTGPNGRTRWPIDDAIDPGDVVRRGHQVMPAMTFAAGKLQLVYYDFADDYAENYQPWVDEADNPINTGSNGTWRKRHTVDVRAAQAAPADVPSFVSTIITPGGTTPRMTRYRTVAMPDGTTKQVQYSPPNYPLYVGGTIPFIGDYIDVQGLDYVTDGTDWQNNLAAIAGGFPNSPVFHAAWTDHRDVKPPRDGDWTNYVAPLPKGADPATSCDASKAGMRNANIYTSRLTQGMFAGSPGNTKPLGYKKSPATGQDVVDPATGRKVHLQRAFVVFVQNTTREKKKFLMRIANQPGPGTPGDGDRASFVRFPQPPYSDADLAKAPYTWLVASVSPLSTIARTVFVTSSAEKRQVRVDVAQVADAETQAIGTDAMSAPPLLANGLRMSVLLNPDPTNPQIQDPDFVSHEYPVLAEEIHDPLILEPLVTTMSDVTRNAFEIHDPRTPDEGNPDEGNQLEETPDEGNPDEGNPDEGNPDEGNPDEGNPDEGNPDEGNPDEGNIGELNAGLENTAIPDGQITASITDVQWKISAKNANTTSAFKVRPSFKGDRTGKYFQLFVTKRYYVPMVDGTTCKIAVKRTNQVIVNIANFKPRNPDEGNPDEGNPDEGNPDEGNPDEGNPDEGNPDEGNTPEGVMAMSLSQAATAMSGNATFFLAPGETATVTMRVFDTVNTTVPAETDPAFPQFMESYRATTAAEIQAFASNTGEDKPASAAAGSDLVTDMPAPSAPASAAPGAVIPIDWTLTNRGTQAATFAPATPIRTRFILTDDRFLLPNGVAPAACAATGPVTLPCELAVATFPGTEVPADDPLTTGVDEGQLPQTAQAIRIPVGLSWGTYYVIVNTDVDGAVFEADDTNNHAATNAITVGFMVSFVVQPSRTTERFAIAPAVQVAISDALGNPVPGSAIPFVTIAIGSNPSAGTLSGTMTQANVGGVASFGDLSIDAPGAGYTLVASAPGLFSATSAPFEIVGNAPALALPDSYVVTRNTTLNATRSVLQNDSDPEGRPLTANLVSGPPAGHILTLHSDGTFVFTPETDYSGTVTFTYCAHDGFTCSSPATVGIEVTTTSVNAPPVALNDSAVTFENTPVTINVLGNDSDPDGRIRGSVLNTPAGAAANLTFPYAITQAPSGLVYFSSGMYVGVVDPSAGRFVARIFTPTLSGAAAAQSDMRSGVVFFSGSGMLEVYAIDARPGSATFNQVLPAIAMPSARRLRSFAIDPVRHLLYAGVSGVTPNEVLVYNVDPTGGSFGQLLATVPLAGGITAVAVNTATNRIYAGAGPSLYVIDGTTRTASVVANSSHPYFIAPLESSNLIYTAGERSVNGATEYFVQAVDGATSSVIATIPLTNTVLDTGAYTGRLAVNEKLGHVYLRTADDGANARLIAIDANRTSPSFNQILAAIQVGADGGMPGLAVDEQADTILTTSGLSFEQGLTIIDAAALGKIADVNLVGTGNGVIVDPVRHRGYVTDGITAISVIDTSSRAKIQTIGVGAVTGMPALSTLHKAFVGEALPEVGAGVRVLNADGTITSVAGLPESNGQYLYTAIDNSRNRVYALNDTTAIGSGEYGATGHIAVIDAATNAALGNVDLIQRPYGITVDEIANRIYVGSLSDGVSPGSITVIDGTSYARTTATLNGLPDTVGFGRDMFVNRATGKLYVRILSPAPSATVPNRQTVAVFDPGSNIAAPLPISVGNARTIRVDGTRNRIYLGTMNGAVYASQTHDVVILDGATDAEVGRLSGVGNPSSYAGAGYLAIDSGRNRLYVTDYVNNTLSVLDTTAASAPTVLATVPVGLAPVAVAVNTATNRIYVSSVGSRTLSIVDGNTNSEVERFALPIGATGLAVDESANLVFASGQTTSTAGALVISDDPGVTALAVTIQAPPGNGEVTVNPDGTVTYTPYQNYFSYPGVFDGFTYEVHDGFGGIAEAHVEVNVIHPNQPPTARNDLYTLDENTTFTSIDNGVLDNDQDDMWASPTSLFTHVVQGPQHGTLALQAHGVFTYTPATNFYGVDTFVYEVSDPDGGRSQATATLNVSLVAPAPGFIQTTPGWNGFSPLGPISSGFGELDALTADPASGYIFYKEHTPTAVSIWRYMAGSTASTNRAFTLNSSVGSGIVMDGGANEILTGRSLSPATGQVVRLEFTGSVVVPLMGLAWTLDPLLNGSGQQQFTLRPDAPVAYFYDNTQAAVYRYDRAIPNGSQVFVIDPTTQAGEHLATTHADLVFDSLRGALFVSDPSSGRLFKLVEPNPARPILTGLTTAVGAITSDPSTGKIFVQVGDAIYGGSPEDESLQLVATIPGLRDIAVGQKWGAGRNALYAIDASRLHELRWAGAAPVARNDTFTIFEDSANALPVLANDSDPNGAPLTIVGFTQPPAGQGTISYGADFRTLAYTPPAQNFTGVVNFTYTIAGFDATATAAVQLTLSATNDAPIATFDSYQVPSNTTLTIAAPGVLANDSDSDGPSPLTAQQVSAPSSGTFSGLNGDGSFTYSNTTPGYYWFTYRVFDGLLSTSANVNINVTQPLALSANVREGVLFESTNTTLAATGGWWPLTFTLTSAPTTLPRGVSLTPSGWFSGSPLETGTFAPSFAVTDSSAPTAQTATGTVPLRFSAVDLWLGSDASAPSITFGAGSRQLAQVFTSGVQGSLTSIRVPRFTCPEGTQLAIEIQSVNGAFPAAPSGTVLASATAAIAATFGSSTPVVLSSPVYTPVDSPFAVVFSSTGADCVATASYPEASLTAQAFIRTGTEWQPLKETFTGRDDLEIGTLAVPDSLVYTSGGGGWFSGARATPISRGRVLVSDRSSTQVEIYDPATGLMSAAGTMSSRRNDPLVAQLPDGRVLFAGGRIWDELGNMTYLDTAEIFDPDSQSFTPVASRMSEARAFAVATALADGRILITGGQDSRGGNTDVAEIFDPATATFASAGNMLRPRTHHTATLLSNGNVLIFGGSGSGTGIAEIFDPAASPASAFRLTSTQPTQDRWQHTATRLPDGNVLIAGGNAASYLLFDYASETFASAGAMPAPRNLATATLLPDGSVLLAGGYVVEASNRWVPTARTERWGPTPGAVRAGAPLQAVRAEHAATALGTGDIFIVGGWNTSAITARSAEIYDPSVSRFVITTGSLPDGSVGTAYPATTIETANGVVGVTFSVAAGALPAGLSLSADGVVSGTPSAAGRIQFSVRAEDAAGHIAYQPFTVFVDRLVITTTTVPDGFVGQAYSAQLGATGYGAKTWSVSESTMPPGLVLDASGAVTGTPTTTGFYSMFVHVVDAVGQSADGWIVIQIGNALTIASPTSLEGVLFYGLDPLWAMGGTAPYNFERVSAASTLPSGLTLLTNGSFDGTSQQYGQFAPLVRVTDSAPNPQTIDVPLSLRVSAEDQESWPKWGNPFTFGPVSGRRLAQVFKSGIAGPLTAIRLSTIGFGGTPVGISCPAATEVSVRIEGVTGVPPHPDGVAVASGRGAAGAPVPVSPSPVFEVETLFAVVLSVETGALDCTATATTSDYYADGEAWVDSTGTWQLLRTGTDLLYDVGLTTLVMPTNLLVTGVDGRTTAAAGLPDGRVLLIGAGPDAQIFDPVSWTFQRAGTMQTVRVGVNATTLRDGKVLITGGYYRDTSVYPVVMRNFDSAELFDPAAPIESRFTIIPGMMPRTDHSATLLADGTVLLAGGRYYIDEYSALGVLEAQIFTGSGFVSAGNMQFPRVWQTATLLDTGAVLIVGGSPYSPGSVPTPPTAELFVPGVGFRATAGPMTAIRANHTATKLDGGYVVVAGGTIRDAPYLAPAYELYNPISDTFSVAASMLVPRSSHSAALLGDGSVLISGGSTTAGYPPVWTAAAERFVPYGYPSTVVNAAPLTTVRANASATTMGDGRVLIVGGGSSAVVARFTAETYDPRCTYTLTTPADLSFTAAGGTGTIGVQTGVACRWFIDVSETAGGWVNYPTSLQTGSATLTISVSPNATGLQRVGWLTMYSANSSPMDEQVLGVRIQQTP